MSKPSTTRYSETLLPFAEGSSQAKEPPFPLRVSDIIIPALILLNLAITITLSATLNIWIDEAFTLLTTSRDIPYAIKHSIEFELQPPAYFVLLNIWRNINSSPFFSRLFSSLCIALSVIIVKKLSEQFFKSIHPGWLVFCFALNPFIIWAGMEIRYYAFVILLSSLLLLYFYDAYLIEHPKRLKPHLLYIGISILSLYTQYLLGFLLLANFFVLVFSKRRLPLFRYLCSMLIVGLLFVPMVLIVTHQVTSVMSIPNVDTVYSSLLYLKVIYWRICEYILPAGNLQWLLVIQKWAFRVGLLAVALLFLRKYKQIINSNSVAIWIILAILACSLFGFIKSFGPDLLELRHTGLIFIPALFIPFTVIAPLNNKKLRIFWLLIISFFYFSFYIQNIYISVLYANFQPIAKTGDWERVAEYIKSVEQKDQPILVFRAEFILPFTYYYKGINQAVPIPDNPDLVHFNLPSQVLKNEEDVARHLPQGTAAPRRFWVITVHTAPFRGIDFHPEILESFIAHGTVVDSKAFFGSKVRLVELPLD